MPFDASPQADAVVSPQTDYVLHLLENAAARIADESRWVQGTVCDNEGRVCAVGAVLAEYTGVCAKDVMAKSKNEPHVRKAMSYLNTAARRLYAHFYVHNVNDSLGHKPVMECFKHAIADRREDVS